MSTKAGPSRGSRRGSEAVSRKDDEEDGGHREQCPTCLRWVTKGLKAHKPDCPGERDFTGKFDCLIPGCDNSSAYYSDMLRHFRLLHPGQEMPEEMKNYRRYFLFKTDLFANVVARLL